MRFLPAGDRTMIVEFGTTIEDDINNQVQFLYKYLKNNQVKGIIELLPTFRSLMICYDPEKTTYFELERKIKKIKIPVGDQEAENKKILVVPCCYEEPYALDREDMEKLTGLSFEEIVKIHSSTDYKIYMLGFLPGFVYLGGLDERIHAKRLDSPRTSIAPGSVGIGGNQTGVYPLASPGGWRLIGSTPLEFYNPARENPFLCQSGEYIRFVPVNVAEYNAIKAKVINGTYTPEYI